MVQNCEYIKHLAPNLKSCAKIFFALLQKFEMHISFYYQTTFFRSQEGKKQKLCSTHFNIQLNIYDLSRYKLVYSFYFLPFSLEKIPRLISL